MGCTHMYGFWISEDLMEQCNEILATGRFQTFSELANYAIRLFADCIEHGFVTEIFDRSRGSVSKTIRVAMYPMEKIRELGNLNNPEIADHALNWYINSFMKGRMEPIPTTRMG